METAKMNDLVELSQVQIEGEPYLRMSNSDVLRPFFMSIVSNANHWMFLSSNGGISAGRKDADNALFPYYTDDKITESADITGSKTLFLVQKDHKVQLWEPFSERYDGIYSINRNLLKSAYGNKVIFEEINHDLGLTFRYQWSTSDTYGFVKTSTIINNTPQQASLSVVDGIQHIMPYGVPSDLQLRSSNLVDAYKKSELEQETGLGIYSLSAIIVDKAEPSEALKANVAWSLGLDQPTHLLSSLQLRNFRKGIPLQEEVDIRAEKGAYFIHADFQLAPHSEKQWLVIADINKTHADLAKLSATIQREERLAEMVRLDIALGTNRLIALNAAADGLQLSADKYRDTRHFANTLFNIMRGGIFDNNYQIEKRDFTSYLAKANQGSFARTQDLIAALPEVFPLSTLQEISHKSEDEDFNRLCLEYLPLKFSRRHGDPSRPWNKFSINTRNESDGSKILDYEGNWRDIFQNWEALAYAYPLFIESMLHKFLNASTFDGYNPYRITKGGFDWETIEPDDPWSYIGYWGDHQIIYLLKFLEFSENYFPGKLEKGFDQPLFVYANVPYKIKSFNELLKNPKDTIEFDHELDQQIRKRVEILGADGALWCDANGAIYRVNFVEKMLATLLAKLSNFIPEGGIWMNTQRPEWNDANNALVGNGVSMVTLYYLRRFLHFFKNLLADSKITQVAVSEELVPFFQQVAATFERYKNVLSGKISDSDRRSILAGVGQAGSDYRSQVYQHGFSGVQRQIAIHDLRQFLELSRQYLEHSIEANQRQDHLYHAYNLMTVENETEISIAYLSEMLEGQVAVLSSGYLSSTAVLDLLDALRNSALYRADQHSYLLYPNKELPRFRAKNNLPKEAVTTSALLTKLVQDGHIAILEQDIDGNFHFNGNFKNANDLRASLEALQKTEYASLAKSEQEKVLQCFEQVFDHKAFTGRSGTFFGYEGLGSIYWHMVSKLQLAVQECCLRAIANEESPALIDRLVEHYYEIQEGIGVHKAPAVYGAFPTDPYSHTPAGKGAQQPGMTGQVKEDIISRFSELGLSVKKGKLYFQPCLLRRAEFLRAPEVFEYVNVNGTSQKLLLEEGSLCFTYCQVPVVYTLGAEHQLQVVYKDHSATSSTDLSLSSLESKKLFERTGEIQKIMVKVSTTILR
ncbi:MAG: hypothetical protein R2828_07745 [Saprospiraceae bacterium]